MSELQLEGIETIEEVHRVLLAAVRQRLPVAAVYDGLARLFCPHVIGWSKNGERRVFGYQYGGESKAGLRPGAGNWRCMSLERFSRVEPLNDLWRTEPHAPQQCVARIEADSDHPEPQCGQ